MKVTVTFELNCCRDCVFCGNGAYEESCCYHPTINYRSYGEGYLEDVEKIPEWCPLVKSKEEQSKLKIDQFAYLFEANDKLECVTFDNIDISNTQPNKNRVKLHCDMEVSKDVFNGLIEHQRRKTKNEI